MESLRAESARGNSPRESTPFRPDVIAAFRTPTSVPELTELLRLVVDVCTPLLSCPDGRSMIEVTFPNGRLAHVVVMDPDLAEAAYLLSPAEADVIEARRAAGRARQAGAVGDAFPSEFEPEIDGVFWGVDADASAGKEADHA